MVLCQDLAQNKMRSSAKPIGMFVVNDMKMVEFILWTDNPKTDIDKISHYIGIQPIEKKRMGEMRCLT